MKKTFKQFLIEAKDSVDWPKDQLIVFWGGPDGSPLIVVGISNLPVTTNQRQLKQLVDISGLSEWDSEDFDFVCGKWNQRIPWHETKQANNLHPSFVGVTFGQVVKSEYRANNGCRISSTWQEFANRIISLHDQDRDFED